MEKGNPYEEAIRDVMNGKAAAFLEVLVKTYEVVHIMHRSKYIKFFLLPNKPRNGLSVHQGLLKTVSSDEVYGCYIRLLLLIVSNYSTFSFQQIL